MKRMVFIPLLAALLFACNQTNKFHPLLLEMESMLIENPDSALSVLEGLSHENNFRGIDLSYYYILQTESRNKSDVSLLESDSLIDFALKDINDKKYPELIARAYLLKGKIQKELKEPQEAIQTFRKGIAILEEKDIEPGLLSKLYNELGSTYLFEFMRKEALTAFRKEYEIDLRMSDTRGKVFSLRNIGLFYLFEEKPDSALHYFDEALKYTSMSKDSVYLSDILHNDISIAFTYQNEYEKAYSEICKIQEFTDPDLLNKAEILIHFGQLDSARAILSQTINSEDISVRSTSSEYLSIIAEKENDLESSLNYYRQYSQIIDTIVQANKSNDIRIIDHKHNSTIAVNRLKGKQKIINIISLFSFLIISLIFLFFLFYLNRKKTKRKKRFQT